ncbi:MULTISPECIES: universal stress protein [unclassified Micromonospora]|uniref:universal stress protein n=1 Tax=unclassified Micromonospora TaxID=2617518 RepID=UPI001C22682C|nr:MULTISPECIES: universal stress protein [unclassified Micromonospora]MBU8856370.1 universal stress protein [Micromonospora sp. WMMB482]MDM4781978.1 universal stress protein [Micromonospora sp. b486]
MSDVRGRQVLVGYDGSPAASAAIEAGALLFPGAHAWIGHLWTPPFASEELRKRLWTGTRNINVFVEAIEREGGREADRMTAVGVMLGCAAGWDAEPLVCRSYGGEGLRLAELADEKQADVLLLGSRGLGGARAVLGSVSDMAVHYSPRPVLVVPHPLLTDEYDALAAGPVVVGWDASAGSEAALAAARRLFPERETVLVAVDGDEGDTPAPETVDGKPVTTVRVRAAGGTPGRAVADALSAVAAERKASLVVVGSRGRTVVRKILLGSVAMATLHRAHRPVMVVPQSPVREAE